MKPYEPNDLPLQNLDYKLLFALVGDANAELARYDGLLQGITNPEVMLSPLTTQEAVLSSKVEGTQATVIHAQFELLYPLNDRYYEFMKKE